MGIVLSGACLDGAHGIAGEIGHLPLPWSIKAVLPTIAPQLDYADLEVKDGGNAVKAYREASGGGCTSSRRIALDQALRAYCGRDVKAMRVIAHRLVVGARSQPAFPEGLASN